MIITPRVFVLVIATGLFWLAAIVFGLLLIAGLVRGMTGMMIAGATGTFLTGFIHRQFKRNEDRIARWVKERSGPER